MTRKSRRTEEPTPVYERIREILESARTTVARSVNTTQVVANWLVGREIVEEQQRGNRRAGYGERLIPELSARLTADFGAGFSAKNLEVFRAFYVSYPDLVEDQISYALRRKSSRLSYSNDETRDQSVVPRPEVPKISDAARRKSPSTRAVITPPIGRTARGQSSYAESLSEILHAARRESWQPGLLHPNLSWTHYRTLLRVDKPEARAFYEIEAIENRWSARELERQINSLLYERLALSKDKKGLMRLATKGQEIQQPTDIFKDPVVMEFLGLPESPRLVETDLEQ